ncbi:uridine kinase [Pseudonocardia bannensis]|uniref:Uridine kinase n=1 Tax=Pseudonocardia bannensis TaxID=630973 RepID=A0A848DG06_9PSEU|nr:uridine kinase [Pseudonocardia bannensis]NMH91489.1 uridine kinase [Pseudonocardia bannensis]
MRITPTTPAALAEQIADLVTARPGQRVRVAVDGAPPTAPQALAGEAATLLRLRGRDVVVVSAADFLRPASVRLEYGRTDVDMFLDGWLDSGALRREVLDPAGPGGSGRVLPRLWNSDRDRAYRDDYRDLADDGVVLLTGALLLGRGLPLDIVVHLRMTPAALTRRTDDQERWTVPAFERYDRERDPAGEADLLVLADHPERPAVRS